MHWGVELKEARGQRIEPQDHARDAVRLGLLLTGQECLADACSEWGPAPSVRTLVDRAHLDWLSMFSRDYWVRLVAGSNEYTRGGCQPALVTYLFFSGQSMVLARVSCYLHRDNGLITENNSPGFEWELPVVEYIHLCPQATLAGLPLTYKLWLACSTFITHLRGLIQKSPLQTPWDSRGWGRGSPVGSQPSVWCNRDAVNKEDAHACGFHECKAVSRVDAGQGVANWPCHLAVAEPRADLSLRAPAVVRTFFETSRSAWPFRGLWHRLVLSHLRRQLSTLPPPDLCLAAVLALPQDRDTVQTVLHHLDLRQNIAVSKEEYHGQQ